MDTTLLLMDATESLTAAPADAAARLTTPRIDSGEAADVRAATDGCARAFERLYRRHAGRVFALCLRLCEGDSLKSEQAAQDAFVKAWEKLPEFRGEAAFGTWLHRIAVNVVLGEYRSNKRLLGLETLQEDGWAGAVEPSTHPQAQWGDRMDLSRALAKLPPGARAVLVLHDIEGWQHQEIAASIGIAVGTSKAQLHRARKLMKDWLQ